MIQLSRETSAERVNALLNHPDIRPWIAAGEHKVDVTAITANPNNVVLMGEHGGCVFLKVQDGVYEVHTQVLPQARGKWTDELTAAVVDWMFLRTGCYEIITRVPDGHVAAKAAAQRRGMRYEFTRPAECLFRGKKVDVDIYSFRIHDWIAQADYLEAAGEAFHKMLHDAAERYAVKETAHPDDPNHNRYVGAALAMLKHGQSRKAVLWYNRWAAVSRHPLVALLKEAKPATVRIDSGFVLLVEGDQMEIHHAMA